LRIRCGDKAFRRVGRVPGRQGAGHSGLSDGGGVLACAARSLGILIAFVRSAMLLLLERPASVAASIVSGNREHIRFCLTLIAAL